MAFDCPALQFVRIGTDVLHCLPKMLAQCNNQLQVENTAVALTVMDSL
jgi:hypothetical protein